MALTKVKISDLPAAEEITISGQENMEISAPTPEGSEYPYVSRRLTFSRFGNWLGNIFNFNQLETDAKTLVGAINEVNDSGGGGSFWDTIPNNAGAHNAIYRGKNLGNPANINWDTIDRGEFEDMFIGDYWEIYDEPTDQTITWRIAAFDYYRGIGAQHNFAHHITVIPDQNIIHSSANIKIFENKGASALTGYMYSNIKGYKVDKKSFTPSDFTYNSTNHRWEANTTHNIMTQAIYSNIDGNIVKRVPNDLNFSADGILSKSDSTGSNPPQFTTATLTYSYKNDTDVQTITETFTNADVLTSGWSSQYNTRGYIKLGHMPISENQDSILEVLVDGVSVRFGYGLRGYYITSNTSGSYMKDAQTIQVTYKYGNNYGGINQASRIAERAFGLSSHIMQTSKMLTIGSYNSLGYFSYNYMISDIDLPSEQQIMGNRTIGVEDNWTDYYDNLSYKTNNEQTGESSQLPLFALNPSLRCNREGYWLKDRCYATPLSDPYVQAELDAFDTHYLCVNPTGEVTAGSGSGLDNNPMGIRPVFNLAKTQSYGYPQ